MKGRYYQALTDDPMVDVLAEQGSLRELDEEPNKSALTHAQRVEAGMSLAKIRKQRGLTIEQVAVLADVDKSTISRAERGLQTLRPMTIVKLSKAFKVSPSRITEPETGKFPMHEAGRG